MVCSLMPYDVQGQAAAPGCWNVDVGPGGAGIRHGP